MTGTQTTASTDAFRDHTPMMQHDLQVAIFAFALA
jgi:hypothetical protein